MVSKQGSRRDVERSESPGSPRDRKRKHEKGDRGDKKEKKSKVDDRKAEDRKVDDRRPDDRKGDRRRGEEVSLTESRGYGYRHEEPDRHAKRPTGDRGDHRGDDRRGDRGGDRDRDRDRGDRERADRDRDRGDRDNRGDTKGRGDRESERQAPPPSPQLKPPKDWRDEVNNAEDVREMSDDEETAKKKLEESRKRRAAMMAKAPKSEETGEKTAASSDHAEGGASEGIIARTASLANATRTQAEISASAAEAEAASAAAREKAAALQQEEAAAAGDMFDLAAEAMEKLKKGIANKSAAGIALTGASTDDWDDGEGYYNAQLGELLEDRYLVHEPVSGKGVFSNVIKCKDTKKDDALVAIKIIRSNDMMKKAAEKEVEILNMLNDTDKGTKKHIIRLFETFYYRKHIFLVFECMADDLRAAVKKTTKGKGMSILPVRTFTKQLMVAMRHMHKCNIIHADIKPDNILIDSANTIVKLCDFGTAFEVKDMMVSPYLMSRFYRPAEVILGCEYGNMVDIWAMACTLYEIFTGKTLLKGKTNNDQLKAIMDLKGKIPVKVIKNGAVWKNHFDENIDFKYEDVDKMTKEPITRIITDNSAKYHLKDLILERVGTEKKQSQVREDQDYVKKSLHFADLLDKMLALNPDNRLSAEDALKHHFLADPPGKADKAQGGKAQDAAPGGRR